MDYLIIDIETKNTFFDVGRDNVNALEVSVVCIYSYKHGKYFSFDEHHLKEAGEMLKSSNVIIGFSINRFDLPVLAKHYDFDLFSISRIDLLEEIEIRMGRRISLNLLAKTNLGVGKNGRSLDAPILYKAGKMEELAAYCINDVKITKDLYELAKKQGYLLVPNKETKFLDRVDFDPAALVLCK